MSQQTTHRHGCHNRAPYSDTTVVQEGFEIIRDGYGQPYRQPKFKDIPHTMSRDCQYTKHDKNHADPSCAGCTWKAQP